MGRSKGEGTGPFEITLPSGAKRWRVAVTMADGRRVWRTARTPREAERIRRGLVEARELDLDPTRQTLAAYLRSWIASMHDARHARVKPRTAEGYGHIVEKHVIPALGSLKLAAVTLRRVHDLRHTAAHLLADAGVSLEARKLRLGHHTDAMATHYSGASEAQDRLAVERLAEAIGGTG